jgi:tetratricopeptide (TPR) repeat protein
MTRWAAVVALLLLAAPLRAEVPEDADTEAARRHFTAGCELYQARKYGEAARELELARRIKPLAEIDYNLARTYERMEEWGRAADAYERYLQHAKGADAQQTRARVKVLRERLLPIDVPGAPAPADTAAKPAVLAATAAKPVVATAAQPAGAAATPAKSATAGKPATAPAAQPAPAPAATTTTTVAPAANAELAIAAAPAPRSRRGLRIAALATGAFALAAAGAGAGLLGSVGPSYHDLETTCVQHVCSSTDWGPTETRANAGYALIAVGGAAAVVDVLLFWRAYRRPGQR